MNKQPELTERTRRCIIDAYWKLLIEKEKLSVISVSRAAAVNRSTFYQYFLDMDDLREQAETQMLEDVKNKISEVFPQGFPVSLKAFAIQYAAILEDEGEKLFFIISSGSNPGFVEKLTESFSPIFCRLFGLSPEMPGYEYTLAFGVSAISGILAKWYKDGKPVSLSLEKGENCRLDILCENMGRVNDGPKIMDRKGVKGVRFNLQYHFGWDMYPLPLDNISLLSP